MSAEPPTPSHRRVRLVGAALILAGILVAQAALGWMGEAFALGSLSPFGYRAGLLAMLSVVLPLMAGGIYLVHKGSLEPRDG